MNKTLLNTIVLSTLGLSLAGCIAIKPDEKFDQEMQEQQAQIQKIKQTKNYAVLNTPKVSYEAFIGTPANKDVFDTTHINMSGMKNGATLRAVIQMFQKKGLNVIAQNGVNLDQSVLNYSIKNASARRALDMVTYDLGIGYHMVDDGKGRPYAVLTGLPSFEYRLNIPNEVKTLSQFFVNKTKETEANLGGAGGNSGGGSSGGSSGGSANGSGSSDVNTFSSLAEIKTSFWDDTESFLNALVKELVLPSSNRPDPRADNFQLVDGPNGQMYQSRAASHSTPHNQTGAVERKVGVVSINRSTGHIYVSAPKHTLDRVEKYLKEIDLLMNSKIVIKGRIIAQTETERQQKGLDVAALAPYCTHSYRCIVSNDIYNNVSISEPGVNTWFSAGVDNMIGSSMLGIQSLDQTWQVFNAYTEDNANIRTIGNFEGEAFHGEDITLSDVQNRINQQLSTNDSVTSDGVTTGGGTSSDLIPYKIGSVITVLPMLDMESGMVKTRVDVKLSVLGENKEITNVIGDDVQKGYYQNVDTMEFKVSPKLKPGELVIAAGRTQTRLSNSIGGTSGLKDSYLGALFGNSERLKEKVTYYILLQAKVVPASV